MKSLLWFAASRDATPQFLAAYAQRFDRPFPPGLLPDEPLHPVGRDLLRRVHAAFACAWARDPRRRRVELMFGTAVARAGKVLIPFSRPAFLQFAPVGYWAAGFAARPFGDLTFYYMRRDAWSHVMFRFACEGTKARDRGALIPRFLEGFDAFAQALRPRASSLVAFEKDGYEARYEIARACGLAAFDRSRLDDGDFAAMLD